MEVYLFGKEVNRARKRFNKIFGKRVAQNLQMRHAAILSICWLGVISERIKNPKPDEAIKHITEEFTRFRDSLKVVFDEMENEIEEGRRLINECENRRKPPGEYAHAAGENKKDTLGDSKRKFWKAMS